MASNNMNNILDRVRDLLNLGYPQEAMNVLSPHLRSGSKLIVSAYAVCLMRLGHSEKAVTLLRDIVYQGSSFSLASDIPTIVKTNFVTALLLSHNIDGAKNILSQLDAAKDEPSARLKAAMAKWEQNLSFFERLQCLWGTPNKQVVLDFPPGDV